MSKREGDEDYDNVVVRLGVRHRLITCRDNMQWILQEKSGKVWRNQSFLTSRDGVIRRCLGLPNADQLSELPARFQSGREQGLG